ncbi:MFS transporter [Pseudomonas sp. KCJK8927]|uniref:MFS transporter n=1 Tax=Pseudomonas sp. KCJK8927 TaxID=3344560 RepID=UPI0039061173
MSTSISENASISNAQFYVYDKSLVGLAGIFVAAMMAGLNNRVGALALADVRGILGAGYDEGAWLTTAYSAGELVAMPFSAWFAIALTPRRQGLWVLAISAALATVLPLVKCLELLVALRFVQGIACGATVPLLMMGALKYLPPSIKLYGLALYAMTATFTPNLSVFLAGYWLDEFQDWRWIYWQIIPLAIFSGALMAWGLPVDRIAQKNFKQANWLGLTLCVPGLVLTTVALDQGGRLDWFESRIVTVSLGVGVGLIACYLALEWRHPYPFIKLQLLQRRNIGIGCALFVSLLVVLTATVMVPATFLAAVQDYRPAQMTLLGVFVAIPQLVLGPVVALLLYRKWVDARITFSLGLLIIAIACFQGAGLTSVWNIDQFIMVQSLHALGQPLAIVSMLFLITSVVQPQEGPLVSGTINTLRALGSIAGASMVGQIMTLRGRFHSEILIDNAAMSVNNSSLSSSAEQLAPIVVQQSIVLSVSDIYIMLGMLALVMVIPVCCLKFIPAPCAD